MQKIKNVYCVGRNYALHAKELNNEIPKFPFLFSKTTHAVSFANGQEMVLPANRGSIHYEVELVIQIGRPYEKGATVDDLVDSMALGIDFTLRDVQSELKKKGHPWLLAKSFPNSAVLSEFITFPGVNECKNKNFSLVKNGEKVQSGNIKDMIFDMQALIDYTALNFGLDEGDILFTGTPEGVGPIADGDKLELLWGEQVLGSCSMKLR